MHDKIQRGLLHRAARGGASFSLGKHKGFNAQRYKTLIFPSKKRTFLFRNKFIYLLHQRCSSVGISIHYLRSIQNRFQSNCRMLLSWGYRSEAQGREGGVRPVWGALTSALLAKGVHSIC